MASGLTSTYLIPYPLSTDPVNVHGDMQLMANQLENVLSLKPDKNLPNIFTQPNIFSISSATDAFRITQTGAGNAFVVEDAANPDTTAFVIDTSGNVAIGKTTASVKLDVVGAGAFTGAVTGSTFNALTLTAAATGFTIAGGTTSKTLTINNTLSFSGTDSTVMTFPSTSQTIAGLTATQLFTNKSLSDSTTYIVDATDNTKRLTFDIAGTTAITGTFATAFTTAKTVTFQDVQGTVYVSTGTDVTLADGGTNASLTAVNGGVVYSTASAMAITAAGTSGQMLQSAGAAAPAWSTATYPATTTINQILYSSAANTISGITTANNQVLVTNASGVPAFSATLPSGVTASSLTSFGTSPTLTTPTIDTINVSGAAIAAALWNTTLTTGSISMGNALTSGSVNIANGTALAAGSVNIASGAGTGNKTIAIGTSATAGTTAITIGSASGATSTLTLNGSTSVVGTLTTSGNVTVGGDLTVNGILTSINTNTLTVDDKNLELGFVASGVVSTTGTVGSITGTGPWTATITGMTDTADLIIGTAITATNGTGSLGAGGTYVVASIVSQTSITYTATGGTTPVAGTVTNITGGGPTNTTADGGGITLKGTTDKTIIWDTTNSNWTSSEHWNIASSKVFKINNTQVLSSTAVLGLTPTINATGYTLSGGTTAVAVTFAGGAAYTISGTNGQTYTMPSTGGTLIANPMTTLGDIIYGGASGAPTRLAGNATNGTYFLRENVTASAAVAPDWVGSTGSGNVVLATSPSLTTPTLGVASATSINKVAITAPATSATLTIADGKTLTVNNSITFSASNDTSTLNIATGGTLGTAAFTNSTAYEPAITTLAISKGGTGTGTAPTQYGVIYASSATAYASTAAGTNTQVLIGNAAGAPTWTNISGLSVSSATTATNLSGTTVNSIPYQSASGTTSYISIGSANQLLAVNGTANGYTWVSPFTNPMTTLGDMIYGGASGASTRLANAGTTNGVYILQETVTGGAATAPSWLGTTGSGNVVLATSATLTTPVIDTINASSATATTSIHPTVTTGSIAIGAGITTGTINIATIGTGVNAINLGNTNTTVTVNGNLTVNGTTTTVNSVTITVDDPNIELNSVASPTDANANGGGITLKGTTDKTIIWDSTNSNWTSNQDWNIPTGKVFKINNTSVLSATAVLGLTPTINATGFRLSGGTTAKYVQINNDIILAGTDGSTLNIGAGGTLGSAAFTASSAYEPAITTLAISKGGTGTGTAPTLNGIIYASATTSYASTAAGTTGQVLIGNTSAAPSWAAANTLSVLSATKLTTARNINGVAFDGTTDITITAAAAANALTGTTLASNVVSSSLTSVGTLTSLTVSGTTTVPTPVNNTDATNKAYVDSVLAAGVPEIIPLDDLSGDFNGRQFIFQPKYQGIKQSITNPLRLQLAINGIIQYVDFPDYVWQSPLPREGFQINNDGNIMFSEAVPAGSRFNATIQPGPNTITKKRQYPFKAVDILLGG